MSDSEPDDIALNQRDTVTNFAIAGLRWAVRLTKTERGMTDNPDADNGRHTARVTGSIPVAPTALTITDIRFWNSVKGRRLRPKRVQTHQESPGRDTPLTRGEGE